MLGTNVLFLSAVLATSCVLGLVASSAAVPAPPAAAASAVRPAAAQDDDQVRGERLMNASCQGCHDLRTIQVQAMDVEGWSKTIHAMVENGATIAKDDIPFLASYLAQHHGPMPDGPGKQIVLNTCTMCHDLKRIVLGRRSSEEWEETLVSMLNEGAPLSEQDFPTVHAYLAKNFGAD